MQLDSSSFAYSMSGPGPSDPGLSRGMTPPKSGGCGIGSTICMAKDQDRHKIMSYILDLEEKQGIHYHFTQSELATFSRRILNNTNIQNESNRLYRIIKSYQ